MVPKGCQFTIPWGLSGTPLKVQVYYSGYIMHYNNPQERKLPLQSYFVGMGCFDHQSYEDREGSGILG